ncbi:hypothetical protein G7Z17_g2423 [Cylindrodendrum hubeiense]|uniref:Uncharacterized protein n=1 Tax=Cylindrodendrum hubeiense TaxID=595255 RepID=A0A9P5HCS9_9HYPO|nr:hypothetical protein G7Z17_g2423 [Cylindrodendrum hubeiense]
MDTDKLWLLFTKETMSTYKTLLPLALAESSRSLEARWCYSWSEKAYEPNDILNERTPFWTGGLDSPDFYPLQAPFRAAAAGLPAQIRIDLEAQSVISVNGFTHGKIVKVGPGVNTFLIGFGRPNYVQLFQKWESLVGGPWEDLNMTKKFAYTVTGGAWAMEPTDWRAWNNTDYSEKAWSWGWIRQDSTKESPITTGYRMSRHDELQENDAIVRYNRVRDDACEGRRIFLLENGEFGLGPESTKVGDQVVILLGSDVPLVVHKRDHTGYRKLWDLENKAKLYKSTWKLVGQAYVHDAMEYPGDLERDINDGQVKLEEYLFD